MRFFTRELDGDERYERRELPAVPEPDLWCSPSGQLYRHRQGLRGVFELNRDFLAAHLSGMLPSWEEVVETRLFDSNTITAAMVIPGVLQQLDLPDLRQCFAGRDLRLEAPLRVAALPDQLPLKRNA